MTALGQEPVLEENRNSIEVLEFSTGLKIADLAKKIQRAPADWAPLVFEPLRAFYYSWFERALVNKVGIRSTDPVLHGRMNCQHLGRDETKHRSSLGGAYRGMGSKRAIGDGVCGG